MSVVTCRYSLFEVYGIFFAFTVFFSSFYLLYTLCFVGFYITFGAIYITTLTSVPGKKRYPDRYRRGAIGNNRANVVYFGLC